MSTGLDTSGLHFDAANDDYTLNEAELELAEELAELHDETDFEHFDECAECAVDYYSEVDATAEFHASENPTE